MIVAMIVAMSEKRGISFGGRLPWRLSTDQRRFKTLTMGHHVVMGRKTYESICNTQHRGPILPGRIMIVVTRQPGFSAQDCQVAHSLEQAYQIAREQGETELFVIGGAEIYKQAFSDCSKMYITLVHCEVQADTFFPAFPLQEWVEVRREQFPAGEKDDCPTTFVILEHSA